MPRTQLELPRVIKYLSAVEISPEIRCPLSYEHMHEGEWCDGVLTYARYAWKGCEFEAYVVAATDVLSTTDRWEFWAAGIDENDPVVVMPDWWTPDSREATRCSICGTVAPDSWDEGPCNVHAPRTWERITADLETGAEVLP